MRIYTVTKENRPLAVVRASDPADAINTALALTALDQSDSLEVREPNDAEMVGWLERRDDYVLTEQVGAG
jgi:hypothetical protein